MTYGESVNTVDDVPDNFKKWVADNEERITRAKQKGTEPYFVKDNRKYLNEGVQKGLNSDLGHKPTKHGEMFEPIDMKKAKLSIEQETNLSEIARKVGFSDKEIKAMSPMSFSDADGGSVNSLTGKNDNTRDNCQSCAPVFELRCRGVDVTAKGYVEGGFAEKLSNDQTLAYITSDGKKPSLTAKFSDADSLLSYLGGSEMAKNGRYQLGFDRWMNSNDGHILNIICVDGKRYLYDGQSNLRFEISDIINRIDFSANVGILRVDKLLFSSEITNILMRL